MLLNKINLILYLSRNIIHQQQQRMESHKDQSLTFIIPYLHKRVTEFIRHT